MRWTGRRFILEASLCVFRNKEEDSLEDLVVITGGVVVGGCGERKVSLYCDVYVDGDGLCNVLD